MEGVTIVRCAADDWRAYREVRLAALTDAPHAFGSTLARELSLTEAEWRARLVRGATFMAMVADARAGTATGIPGDHPEDADLVGMWVDPRWRGRGVGVALVEAVIDWAAKRGFRTVKLWVAVGNGAAEALYRRCGFLRTGRTQPVRPHEPDRLELEMQLLLAR